MKRRAFIKKTAIATAGAFAAPYILPTGRLFASTGGNWKADHVVLVLFAGGVRHQESIQQLYLAGSQYGLPGLNDPVLNVEGNIMFNMLNGQAPASKKLYGTGVGGVNDIPKILTQSLQTQGTLFKEVTSTAPGHYAGLNVVLQGNTLASQGLKQRPLHPTIFEYLRRHAGFKATETWFIGNGIGGSIPYLNHSQYPGPDYGAKHGANFFAPLITFGYQGDHWLSDAKNHPQEQLDKMYQMKLFLDLAYENIGKNLPDVGNTDEEKFEIKEFMKQTFNKVNDGSIISSMPPVHLTGDGNGDTQTVGFACEVMKKFKPRLTVVNLSNVDVGHGNFTASVRALHRADHAVGHMWNFIQTNPELASTMQGNTIILAVPECGRNTLPNAVRDTENNFYGYDHSDQNTQRVFTFMAGRNVPQNTIANQNNFAQTADIAPTIADIFDIKNDVLNSGLMMSGANSLFDKIY